MLKKPLKYIIVLIVIIAVGIYFKFFTWEQASDFLKKWINSWVDYVKDNRDSLKDKAWDFWAIVDAVADNQENIKKYGGKAVDGAVSVSKELSTQVSKHWEGVKTFNKAKKILERNVYNTPDKQITFYCGCKYSGKQVDLQSCWYVPNSNKMIDRANKVEWEHIVPAERFGRTFKQWDQGHPDCIDSKGIKIRGRKCANKTSPEFNAMEADLFNLVPAVWEVNGLRSNFEPTEKFSRTSTPKFWNCDIEIYSRQKFFAPSEEIRGDIARTYIYMASAYPENIILTDSEKAQFERWDKEDPITKEECEIYKIKKGFMKRSIESYEKTCKSI